MFDSLKTKLKTVQEKFSNRIKSNLIADGTGSVRSTPGQGKEKANGPQFVEKVKTFVKDRELILTEKDITEPLSDLELVLLESDVALPVTDTILTELQKQLIGKHRKIGTSVDDLIIDAIRNSLLRVLGTSFDLISFVKTHERPVKILFTGVNGTGKTTTIAKVAHFLKKSDLSTVIASGDTYRAGALEQLSTHAQRVGIKIIQHQPGGDPSAVIFDTVQYAIAHHTDVVLADTAGRFHNRANLMNQLEKIRRVMKPDLIIYVDEAVAGNDAIIRADEFNKLVGMDAVVLTKADIDMKGGAAISIAHTIGKPILFFGTGQGYDDLVPFVPEVLIRDLLGGG